MDKAEAMRHHAGIPESWWEFSVNHAVHVYNRSPMRRLEWKTPFELLNGETPDVSDFKVFGCGAWVWMHPDCRANKLALKAKAMMFVGYPAGVKGY